jgi:hypothetical protein
MASKVFLNVLCNLAILTCGLCFFWGVKHQHFMISSAAVAAIILMIYLKLGLIKQVKELAKKKG